MAKKVSISLPNYEAREVIQAIYGIENQKGIAAPPALWKDLAKVKKSFIDHDSDIVKQANDIRKKYLDEHGRFIQGKDEEFNEEITKLMDEVVTIEVNQISFSKVEKLSSINSVKGITSFFIHGVLDDNEN